MQEVLSHLGDEPLVEAHPGLLGTRQAGQPDVGNKLIGFAIRGHRDQHALGNAQVIGLEPDGGVDLRDQHAVGQRITLFPHPDGRRPREETARAAFAVILQVTMKEREHGDTVVMREGKGQVEAQHIALGLGQVPACILGRSRNIHGRPRREVRRDERGGRDGERGVDGRQRGERHVHATGHPDLGQDPTDALAHEVAHHGPDHGVDDGLGKEHEEDIARRNTNGVVDVNLVAAFIDGSANRVQHHQRSDHKRDYHIDQPRHTRLACALAQVGLAVQTVVHGSCAAFHVGVDLVPGLLVRQFRHRHRDGGDDLLAVLPLAGLRDTPVGKDDDLACRQPRGILVGQHLPAAPVDAHIFQRIDIEGQQVLSIKIL